MEKYSSDEVKKMLDGVVSLANGVLGTNIKRILLEESNNINYYGSHILLTDTISINKQFFDDLLICKSKEEHFAKFVFVSGIIAHEIRHVYQESLNDARYLKEFLIEQDINEKIKLGLPFNKRQYVNLNIEVDAHAFQALIEEKYFEKIGADHFPIPELMDEKEFNKQLLVLKEMYKKKIDAIYATIYLQSN